jgi:hypothetical protein
MLHRMTYDEFLNWKARYAYNSPFGDWREDMRFGHLASPIVNLMKAYIEKHPKFTTAEDWLMKFELPSEKKPKDRKTAVTAMFHVLKALAESYKK